MDDQSILTTGTELTAAATTATTSPSAELLEMRALAKSLADTNATQQRQLTTALAQLKVRDVTVRPDGGAGGDRTKARRGAPRTKHVCKNCNREVWHLDAKCMELEANAHLRYDGWKSCLG